MEKKDALDVAIKLYVLVKELANGEMVFRLKRGKKAVITVRIEDATSPRLFLCGRSDESKKND